MRTGDFDFDLPRELIAQEPVHPRDASRLLLLDRPSGGIRHMKFLNIVDLFQDGDLLVVNDTKVIPARLFGRKLTGGKVEILLLAVEGDEKIMLRSDVPISEARWTGYVRGKNMREGKEIEFDGITEKAVLEEHLGGTRFVIRFFAKDDVSEDTTRRITLEEILSKVGVMPTPPYVKKELGDPLDYQTAYADHPGSIAAPTAGFHFSENILDRLREKGVNIASVTLHVGPGTFRPVDTDSVEEFHIEREYYTMSGECASAINSCIENGNRLWIVGTTTMKTLESVQAKHGKVREDHGNSDLFIHPPYRFRTRASYFLTNFHLPRSTLIMMISAYAGRDKLLAAYSEAVRRKYRFYSFGDAMLIRG